MAKTEQVDLTRDEVLARLKKYETDGKVLEMKYDGGGDSGDFSMSVDGDLVDDEDLWSYINAKFDPYFYVNSDGHYEGESGYLTVDYENKGLLKVGTSHYNDTVRKTIKPDFDIPDWVSISIFTISDNFDDDNPLEITYMKDVVQSEETLDIVRDLVKSLKKQALVILKEIRDEDGFNDGDEVNFTTSPEGIQVRYNVSRYEDESTFIPL
jgi:hypothetical protein